MLIDVHLASYPSRSGCSKQNKITQNALPSPTPHPSLLCALQDEADDINRMLTQLLWGLSSQVQSHMCVWRYTVCLLGISCSQMMMCLLLTLPSLLLCRKRFCSAVVGQEEFDLAFFEFVFERLIPRGKQSSSTLTHEHALLNSCCGLHKSNRHF